MKVSLVLQPRRPLDRPTAWACLIANLLVLPGTGSLVAGRRVGYLQATLALLGALLTCAFAGWFLREVFQTRTLPEEFGPWLWIGVAGFSSFLGAWFWALISSLCILSEASPKPPRL